MKLLVFIGPRGAGKDTAYEILKEKNLAAAKLSFAEPLKLMCESVFGVSATLLNDPAHKDKPFKEPITINIKHLRAIREMMSDFVSPYEVYYNLNRIPQSHIGVRLSSPRDMLQYIGTNLIRNDIFQDWHCEAAFSKKNLTRSKYAKASKSKAICVTDCRFPNELDRILKTNPNAKLFFIEREEAEDNLAEATHASELEINKLRKFVVDKYGEGVILKNNGSLKDFEKVISKAVNKKTIENMKNTETLEEGQLEAGSKFRWTQR
jgi:hypothetical protein